LAERKTGLFFFCLALAAAWSCSAIAQTPFDEEALRTRLPKNCDFAKAPKPFKLPKKGPLPTAREIAESYGPLDGQLAELIASAPDVDFAFDTDLCDSRDYELPCGTVSVEVTEYLLCGQPIEIEAVPRKPLDPLAGVKDEEVDHAVYAIADEPPLAISGAGDVGKLVALLRAKSASNTVETASRPLKLKDGTVRPSESHDLSIQGEDSDGLTLYLRGGKVLAFRGHARTGEFEGFYNQALYPFLAQLANGHGASPPSR